MADQPASVAPSESLSLHRVPAAASSEDGKGRIPQWKSSSHQAHPEYVEKAKRSKSL